MRACANEDHGIDIRTSGKCPWCGDTVLFIAKAEDEFAGKVIGPVWVLAEGQVVGTLGWMYHDRAYRLAGLVGVPVFQE